MNAGRKRMVGMLAAVNLLGLCLAGNVLAASVDNPNYGALKVGLFQPTNDLDDADFDTGWDVAGTYGRYLNRYLVAEASIDGFSMDSDIRSSNEIAGNYKLDSTLSVAAILVTLKGELPFGPASIFGGIGGGFYTATLDSDIDSSQLGSFSTDDDDQAFGAHVVLGANYDITDRFFLGLEGMYRWTDDLDIHASVASIPVEYSGDLSGFSVTFNGGFRF